MVGVLQKNGSELAEDSVLMDFGVITEVEFGFTSATVMDCGVYEVMRAAED